MDKPQICYAVLSTYEQFGIVMFPFGIVIFQRIMEEITMSVLVE